MLVKQFFNCNTFYYFELFYIILYYFILNSLVRSVSDLRMYCIFIYLLCN